MSIEVRAPQPLGGVQDWTRTGRETSATDVCKRNGNPANFNTGSGVTNRRSTAMRGHAAVACQQGPGAHRATGIDRSGRWFGEANLNGPGIQSGLAAA